MIAMGFVKKSKSSPGVVVKVVVMMGVVVSSGKEADRSVRMIYV